MMFAIAARMLSAPIIRRPQIPAMFKCRRDGSVHSTKDTEYRLHTFSYTSVNISFIVLGGMRCVFRAPPMYDGQYPL